MFCRRKFSKWYWYIKNHIFQLDFYPNKTPHSPENLYRISLAQLDIFLLWEVACTACRYHIDVSLCSITDSCPIYFKHCALGIEMWTHWFVTTSWFLFRKLPVSLDRGNFPPFIQQLASGKLWQITGMWQVIIQNSKKMTFIQPLLSLHWEKPL